MRKVIIIIGAVVLGFWISSRFTDHNSSQLTGLDSASCTVSKIAIDKLKVRPEGHGYFRITGRLTNNCDQPTGVQIKVTVYDTADNILASPDGWPASTSNNPAHSEYPFEWLQEAPGFHNFTVSVVSVKLGKEEDSMSEESAKFDALVRKVFSVSHDEIVKREKAYQRKRKRAKEKRVKKVTK